MQGVWRRAAIPLTALHAGRGKLAGLEWLAGEGHDLASFSLDDVSLLPPDTQLPVLSECAIPPPIRGFVERRDGALSVDGVPFRAVGANLYYVQQELSRHVQTGEIRPLAHVRSAFSAAVCAGVNVVRILGFNDSPPETQDSTVIQTSPGVFREEGLRGLDLALAEARAQHLRIILTLTNNWSAFGGLPRYAQWAQDNPDAAMDDPQVRDWILDYARMLALRVNTFTGIRYRDDPTILAVEIANELRCRDCQTGHDATAFTLSLARGVAAAWPDRLIADGGEGFDDSAELYPGLAGTTVVAGDEGTSFRLLAEAPEIDLMSYHLYPESWNLSEDQAIRYIDAHESIARAAGKVAYMGEFGLHSQDVDRAAVYEQWLHRLFVTNGGSLGLVWQFAYPGRPDNDGFALVPGESGLSMAALARYSQILSAPELDGVSLAFFKR
jgi:mannan endo-1,4-beta-mannosidase